MQPTLDFLVSLGEEAAKVILGIYAGFQPDQVDFKKGQEPVTAADRAANRLIAARLRERFPRDVLLTEEEGLERPDGSREGESPAEARVWFVDPIDGTKEFIKKNGEFAIQIGLAEKGKLLAGLLLQPVSGDLWVGARGQGCRYRSSDGRWNLLRIAPPAPDVPLCIAVSRSHPSSLARRLGERLGPIEIFQHGSVGLKLMHIVTGDADFYLNDSNSTKAWDIAAPEALFAEAGGVVTDLRGQPFSYDPGSHLHHHGLLASRDPALHQRLLALIAELRAG